MAAEMRNPRARNGSGDGSSPHSKSSSSGSSSSSVKENVEGWGAQRAAAGAGAGAGAGEPDGEWVLADHGGDVAGDDRAAAGWLASMRKDLDGSTKRGSAHLRKPLEYFKHAYGAHFVGHANKHKEASRKRAGDEWTYPNDTLTSCEALFRGHPLVFTVYTVSPKIRASVLYDYASRAFTIVNVFESDHKYTQDLYIPPRGEQLAALVRTLGEAARRARSPAEPGEGSSPSRARSDLSFSPLPPSAAPSSSSAAAAAAAAAAVGAAEPKGKAAASRKKKASKD